MDNPSLLTSDNHNRLLSSLLLEKEFEVYSCGVVAHWLHSGAIITSSGDKCYFLYPSSIIYFNVSQLSVTYKCFTW